MLDFVAIKKSLWILQRKNVKEITVSQQNTNTSVNGCLGRLEV
jgi:hypothetical protein